MIHFPRTTGIELAPSTGEMRRFDEATIAAGTSSAKLMERAGSAAALRLKSLFSSRNRSFLVLCGPGNNGGDGFVAAGKLGRAGYKQISVLLVESERYSEDCVRERDTYLASGKPVLLFSENPEKGNGSLARIGKKRLQEFFCEDLVIVDALLGTGQREAPRGAIRELLYSLNAHAPLLTANGSVRVSIDVPTGINADTGEVYSPHFLADVTMGIERVKRGCLQYPARSVCGDIFVESIGIDCSGDCECAVLSGPVLPPYPERREDAHKGQAGRVVIIGGSLDMPGAPILAAHAALRAGSGLVTAVRFDEIPAAAAVPELLYHALPGTRLETKHIDAVKAVVEHADCVVVGPGMGQDASSAKALPSLVEILAASEKSALFDADALNLMAEDLARFAALGLSRTVLTPHPGEAARLLKWSISEVQADRYSAARELYVQSAAAAVVLKGASTVVYGEPGGFVNLTGNQYMATAGSGDVLSGVIASLIGQGMSALDAAKLGVYVHGLAGDRAHRASGGPITASDITASLPFVIWEKSSEEVSYC